MKRQEPLNDYKYLVWSAVRARPEKHFLTFGQAIGYAVASAAVIVSVILTFNALTK